MTLANLLAIQRLQAFNATPQGVQRGDPVTDGVVNECLTQADTLLAHTRQFLQAQFPDLLVKPKNN